MTVKEVQLHFDILKDTIITRTFLITFAHFRSFLCDNFDYDEEKAMALLVEYGLIENLFEVGKVSRRY